MELELELIHNQMAQKPVVRAEVSRECLMDEISKTKEKIKKFELFSRKQQPSN
jgi:hypothetical protein